MTESPAPYAATTAINRSNPGMKHLWLIPFMYGALLAIAGVIWLVQGAPFDHATYEKIVGKSWSAFVAEQPPASLRFTSVLVRELGGNIALVAGILIMLVAANAFRNREPWSWWAMWLLPVHAASDAITVYAYGALTAKALVWDASLFLVTAGALLLSFREFFPSAADTNRA